MKSAFLLGGHRVDPSTRRVTIRGACHQLEPKAMAVLCELARRPGDVISRAELLEAVWPETFVADGILTRAIHLLRHTFKDEPRAPRFIETVARTGYRLIAEVEPVTPVALFSPAKPVAGRRGPMVGRLKERAMLERALEHATVGHGSLVLVSGEPGIGKTRLTEELASMASNGGAVALLGHCVQAEGAPPYAPWIEILETTIGITPPAALRELLGDGAPEIAKLVPELRRRFRDLEPPLDLPRAEGRRYLFRCLGQLVENAGRARLLVLILEDLHWADEATVHLLGHLAPQIRTWPVLLVATYRSTETALSEPLRELLARLIRERLADSVPLGRLDSTEVASMLGTLSDRPVPETLVDVVYRETEGNPFFVEEVFLHLREQGRLFDGSGDWLERLTIAESEVPPTTRLLLTRRLGHLSEDGRETLEVAATIGRRFSFDLLAKASGLDRDRLIREIDDAARRSLIAADPDTDDADAILMFVHELIRQTLLAAVSAPRRRRLHLKVADALETLGPRDLERNIGAIAHHLFNAGAEADPERTASFLERAGDQSLERLAFEEAVHDFDRALTVGPGREEDHARILRRRGRAHRGLGDWARAIEDWSAALPLAEAAGDVRSTTQLCRDLGHLFIWPGKNDEARRFAERGLACLPPDPSPERCRLLAIAAWAGAGNAMIRDAITMAEAIGNPQIHGEVLIASSWLYLARMRSPEQACAAALAIERLRHTGDLWNLADALAYFQHASRLLGDLASVDRYRDEAEPLARRLGHHGARLNSLQATDRGQWMKNGGLDEYELAGRVGAGICVQAEIPLHSNYALWLAKIEFYHGHFEAACSRTAEALGATRISSMNYGYVLGGLILWEAYLGRHSSALHRLQEAQELLPHPGQRSSYGAYTLLLGAIEALATLGEAERASELYPLARQALATGTVVSPDGRTLIETVCGIAAASGGQWPTAERHFETALRQADEIPFRSEQAEARRWYAAMLIERNRKGDRERAAELLDRAENGYRELGMPRHLTIAKELAARL